MNQGLVDDRGALRRPKARALVRRLTGGLLGLGLLALLGHASPARVEGAPGPDHQDLTDQISALQATVNTLQTTVNNLPAALGGAAPWSQALPAAARFVSVLGGAAVLDKETGLVWEQNPSASQGVWQVASVSCNQKTLGGRKGWRLPTVQELASLVDPTATSGPALPSGHPFTNVQADGYWTATAHASTAATAWYVNFAVGVTDVFVVDKTYPQPYAWCVRGGAGAPDAQ